MTQTTILLRRSNTVGSVPTSGTLALGEVALDMKDGQLYYHNTVVDRPQAIRPVSRSVVTVTTGILNASVTENGFVDLGKAYTLYQVSASSDARIRLYRTDVDRAADASRQAGTDPLFFQEHGIILDLLVTGSFCDWRLAPMVMGAGGSGSAVSWSAYAIQNIGASPTSISVAFGSIRNHDVLP